MIRTFERGFSTLPKVVEHTFDSLVIGAGGAGLRATMGLAEKGYNKILWECGPKLATSAIKSDCIQECITFVAPKILGGDNCMTPFSDFKFTSMKEIINLNLSGIDRFGDDICLISDL